MTINPVEKSPAILQLGVTRPSIPSKGDAVVKAEHCNHVVTTVSKFYGLVSVAHAMDAESWLNNRQSLA